MKDVKFWSAADTNPSPINIKFEYTRYYSAKFLNVPPTASISYKRWRPHIMVEYKIRVAFSFKLFVWFLWRPLWAGRKARAGQRRKCIIMVHIKQRVLENLYLTFEVLPIKNLNNGLILVLIPIVKQNLLLTHMPMNATPGCPPDHPGGQK